jgi:hypothetical protein
VARIRTIKPEFWTHEDLSLLPEATHMLAAALLNHSDDEGYFNANPGLVKAACCPLREPSVSIQDSLKALENIGFIRTCAGSDGKRYGQVVTFDDHQRVNRPTPSKIKPLCSFTESSVSPQEKLIDDSPPERKGKEQGKEGKGEGASGRFVPPTIEEVAAYCAERGNGIDPETFVDHYQANGWMRNKSKVKDWRACVRTWESGRKADNKNSQQQGIQLVSI